MIIGSRTFSPTAQLQHENIKHVHTYVRSMSSRIVSVNFEAATTREEHHESVPTRRLLCHLLQWLLFFMGRHYSSSYSAVQLLIVSLLLLDALRCSILRVDCAPPFKLDDSILDSLQRRDRERQRDFEGETQDKRSLDAKPFQKKYMGTKHHQLEVLADGTVRGSTHVKPEFGRSTINV